MRLPQRPGPTRRHLRAFSRGNGAFLRLIVLAGMVGALGNAALAEVASSDPSALFGVWRNPSGAVDVEVTPCGEAACGRVVRADAAAQAAARRSGTPQMVGLEIFRDLKLSKDGAWRGKVFAPDVGRTFSGSARVLEGDRMRAKGCALAGLICKSQLWTRLDGAAE